MTNNDYDSQLPVIISDIYHNWRKTIDAININNQILASLPLEDQEHLLRLLDHIRSVTTQLSSTHETPHDNIT